MLTTEDKGKGEPEFVLAESDFVSSLLQLTFLPPDYFHSHIFLPHSSNLLECHWCSYHCCLFLFYPAVLIIPACPHASPGTCTCGPSLDPCWVQEMTQFLGHFCHSLNATQGGWPFPVANARAGSLHAWMSPLWLQPQTHDPSISDRPYFPSKLPTLLRCILPLFIHHNTC